MEVRYLLQAKWAWCNLVGLPRQTVLMRQWAPPVPQSGLAAIHLAECELQAEPEREAYAWDQRFSIRSFCRAENRWSRCRALHRQTAQGRTRCSRMASRDAGASLGCRS